ncbi:MAG: hypothetical protein NVS9B10_03120 [Nevskia sp.]
MSARTQDGAALAVSLLILIVLTLLGIAAMRSSRLELKLSQNAESRINALETAQAVADAVTQSDSNLSISAGPGFIGCYVASVVPDSLPNASLDQYPCSDSTTVRSPLALSTALPGYTYAQALRETPEFLTTAALRGAGNSGRSYDFARFTVTGGYDSSAAGFGAAEVTQGTLKLHTKPQGVTYQ